MLDLLLPLWLLSAVLAQIDEHVYCSIRYARLCQGKGTHVGCQFPHRVHGDSCENYTAVVFTDGLKHFILHYVNRRRQRVAAGHERVRGGIHLPKPEIMMLVQWDRELALLAQRLADQCRFVHDDCRATVRYPYAGQTVGEVRWRRAGESMETGARRTIGRVFDAWWGERRRVQPKQLTTPFTLNARGAVWGHFSQLAVWTLRAMGCGAVHHGSSRPRLLLVCDFSHTNMLGQRTISPGPIATCPLHTTRIHSSRYPLLCAPVRHVQPDIYNEEDEDEDSSHRYYEEPVDMNTLRTRATRPIRTDDYGELEPTGGVQEDRETGRHYWKKEKITYDDERRKQPERDKIDTELNLRIKELQRLHKAAQKSDLANGSQMRRKGQYKARQEESCKDCDRSRRPAAFMREQWRDSEDNEIGSSVISPIKEKSKLAPAQGETTIVVYRPTSLLHSTEATPQYLRQRWKRPRNRPRRPGANVLLHAAPSKATRGRAKASLTLDAEDQDQLFLDTGFKVTS